MDAGLRARTKQLIEFGWKISFNHRLPIRIPVSYIVSNSRIQKITQCNPDVNETQHSCGEVQQVAHKGIIQRTILRF